MFALIAPRESLVGQLARALVRCREAKEHPAIQVAVIALPQLPLPQRLLDKAREGRIPSFRTQHTSTRNAQWATRPGTLAFFELSLLDAAEVLRVLADMCSLEDPIDP